MRTLASIVFVVAAMSSSPAVAEEPRLGPPAWLGIELAPGAHGGVAVRGVLPGSPAFVAGVHAGDEVLELGGHKVASAEELVRAVQGLPVGARLTLRLVGRSVAVLMAARPDPDRLQHDLVLDKPAPDVSLHVAGRAAPLRLSSLRGQVVLLDFFATWCGPCKASMPRIERLHERLDGKGLQIIGVSTEEATVVAGAAARFSLKYPLAADSDAEVSSKFHVYALPTIVIVDRKGIVRAVSVADAEAAEQLVDELVK